MTEFSLGGIPHDEAQKSIRLFAARVLPVLQNDSAFAASPAPATQGSTAADLFAAA